jgi:hypothetical protein
LARAVVADLVDYTNGGSNAAIAMTDDFAVFNDRKSQPGTCEKAAPLA